MHVHLRRGVVVLHLLCFFTFVCSRKRDKGMVKSSDNEIFEKTHVITVKFPKVDIPANSSSNMTSTVTRRRANTHVEPIQENCQSDTFKEELRKLRQNTKCEPRDSVVDLVSNNGEVITPNAVVVKRCGGMCGRSKRCLSVEKRNVKFYVKTISGNQLHCSSILVPEDTKCKCGCQQKMTDCSKNQTYNREKCACVCKNEKDYQQCVQNPNENLYWDESNCSCVCHQSKSCTTGTFWKERECRCVKTSP